MPETTQQTVTIQDLTVARDLAIECCNAMSWGSLDLSFAGAYVAMAGRDDEPEAALDKAEALVERRLVAIKKAYFNLAAALSSDVLTILEAASASEHGIVSHSSGTTTTYHEVPVNCGQNCLGVFAKTLNAFGCLPQWAILLLYPEGDSACPVLQPTNRYDYYETMLTLIGADELAKTEHLIPHIRREYALAVAWLAAGDGSGDKASEPAQLDDQEIKILRVLRKHPGKLLTSIEIEANNGPTRKTIGAKLPRLIRLGFAVKAPKGQRGAAITKAGLAAVEPFLPKKPTQ